MAVNTQMALRLVKQRLNRLEGDTSLDDLLAARIDAAVAEIEATGIRLTESMDDMMLAVDMAVWQYQCRDQQTGMPDWLRARRRERWLRERDS